jgi:zinc transport system permease protein
MFNLWEIVSYGFMQRALIAAVILAVVAPTVGIFFVIRRFSSLADTLAHVSLAGIAIASVTGLPPIVCTLGTSLLAAFGIERLRHNSRIPPETILTLILFGSLALGVALLSISSQGGRLMHYLFGSILTVQEADLWIIGLGGLMVMTCMAICWRRFLAIATDEDVARVSGLPVTTMNVLLLALGAITIAIAMNVVGVLLVGSLMIVPVLTAMQLRRSFSDTWIIAVAIAITCVVFGLIGSFAFNTPSGATMALCTIACFIFMRIFSFLCPSSQ